MSYFPGSSNFAIQTFNVLSGFPGPANEALSPGDRLYSKVVLGAVHDSEERCDAPKCHPETRTAVQADIISWIRRGDDDDRPMKMMWITGPAGSGKTAIAGSVAESCEEEGLLAATFFFSSFSGSEDRRLKRGLITTLIYQIFQLNDMEGLRKQVLSTIEQNPAIFGMRLQKQMEILILKPLRDRHKSGAPPILAKVIIIDGLDEVEHPESRQLEQQDARPKNEAEQTEILCAVHHAASDPFFPFRILIASRPERVIQSFFLKSEDEKESQICRNLFLHEQYDADSDIRLFLNAKFAEIRRRYHIPPSWPSEAAIEQLVETASGQFIYASTVVRFLESNKLPNPQGRLQTVLDLECQCVVVNPLAPLDALYTRILMSSPDPFLATRWIGAIDSLSLSLPAWFARQLLQEFEGQAEYLLENLASLIKTPQDIEAYNDSGYQFYHKSLLDFLRSERCGPELRDAFERGSSLKSERIDHAVKEKSSNVPVPEAHTWDFRRHMLTALGDDLCKPPDPPLEGLATCDVVWWVHTMATVLWDQESPGVDNYVELLYSKIHKLCKGGESESFHDCLAVCKHWRGNMHRACIGLGWKPPDAVELLREKLDLLYFGESFQYLTCKFCCPKQGQGHACPPPLESLPPTIYGTTIQEYEQVCNAAADLFSRLPGDWNALCGPDVPETYGGPVFKALPVSVRDALFGARDYGGVKNDGNSETGDEKSDEADNASLSEGHSSYNTADEDQYEGEDEGEWAARSTAVEQ